MSQQNGAGLAGKNRIETPMLGVGRNPALIPGNPSFPCFRSETTASTVATTTASASTIAGHVGGPETARLRLGSGGCPHGGRG